MIRRPPRSTQSRSSAASDVYKRQVHGGSILINSFKMIKLTIRSLTVLLILHIVLSNKHVQKHEERKICNQVLRNAERFGRSARAFATELRNHISNCHSEFKLNPLCFGSCIGGCEKRSTLQAWKGCVADCEICGGRSWRALTVEQICERGYKECDDVAGSNPFESYVCDEARDQRDRCIGTVSTNPDCYDKCGAGCSNIVSSGEFSDWGDCVKGCHKQCFKPENYHGPPLEED
eukprot:TRINITY_DN9833_c0_g1_i4.p1 TRINITY_DN9833_c0_g1~~TRINITY_DN9833_c0_g1_i4.p1  ORF type:complete len:234 (-),score=33.26 TRINITY_DN9833_c0_g1_i4:34-735(-)